MAGNAPHSISVEHREAGQRLDRYLRRLLPAMPLSHLYVLLRKGKIRVNGRPGKMDARLNAGDRISLAIPEAELAAPPAREQKLRQSLPPREFPPVIYRDDHLLALNKPAGLAVHSGTGHVADNVIDLVLAHLGPAYQTAAFRPALAHRLDRDTSGVLLIALNAAALRNLEEQWRAGVPEKHYLALAVGPPPPSPGVIRTRVRRREEAGPRARVLVSDPAGKPAVTRYRVLASRAGYHLLELIPATGRTHQLRAHLREIGLYLAGDHRYGQVAVNRALKRETGLARHFLHAFELKLRHPADGRALVLHAPAPPELTKVVKALRLERGLAVAGLL